MNALYQVHTSVDTDQVRCFVYRYAPHASLGQLVTVTRASTARQAVKLARLSVRTARKCGGLAKG